MKNKLNTLLATTQAARESIVEAIVAAVKHMGAEHAEHKAKAKDSITGKLVFLATAQSIGATVELMSEELTEIDVTIKKVIEMQARLAKAGAGEDIGINQLAAVLGDIRNSRGETLTEYLERESSTPSPDEDIREAMKELISKLTSTEDSEVKTEAQKLNADSGETMDDFIAYLRKEAGHGL